MVKSVGCITITKKVKLKKESNSLQKISHLTSDMITLGSGLHLTVYIGSEWLEPVVLDISTTFYNVYFQKISIFPHRRDWKFQGGWGVSKA